MLTQRFFVRQVPLSLIPTQKIILSLLASVLCAIPLVLGLPEGHSASESAAMPAPSPVPVVTLGVPSEVMIGEDFTFEVKFDNTAGPVGYGPYIEIYLPAKGADSNTAGLKCDGISFQSTVTPVALFTNPPTVALPPTSYSTLGTSTGNQDCADPYTLPFTGMTNDPNVPSGDFQLVVLELPFGSFDATQPEITVKVTAHLSDYADLGAPLTIFARGGFRYGSDPSDNPSQDQLIQSNITSAQTTPTVLKISKAYIGPEGETATGPNFVRKYTINVDIADTQPINDLVVNDNLPANLQYLGNLQAKIKGSPVNVVSSCSTTPGLLDVEVSPPLPGPNGMLSVKFCSPITGSTAADDVSITFDFFIPDLDASGQLIITKDCSNAPVAVENDISATGNWDPLDPRDAALNTTIPVNTDLHKVDNVIQAKCLAIQKSKVTIVQNQGGSGFTPGDTLEYEIDFQVSDYFTIGKLVVKDYLGDGQDYLAGPTSTLTVSDQFGSKTGSFPAVLAVKDEPGTENFCSPSRPPQSGIVLTFDVSAAMAVITPLSAFPRLDAGILTGGLAAGAPLMAPAKGKIVFRTKIRDEFRFLSTTSPGDKYVDKHDPINNCVRIDGSVYANVNRPSPINAPLNIPSAIIGTGSDTSKLDVTIAADELEKNVYAVKRGTTFLCGPTTTACVVPPAAPEVQPGDEVTFRIKKRLPSGDGEDVTIQDWMPLPIFNIGSGMTFNNTACTGVPAIPATGNSCLGPTDTVHSLVSSGTPSFVADPGTNSFTFTYGDFNDPANQVNFIDILFTHTVTNVPFADGLFLTNDSLECEGTTFSATANICQRSIAQVKVREPKLSIKKGVVATDNPNGVFTPALNPAGVWKPFGSSCPDFQNGPITSGTLGGLINSNLSNVDANDQVTFGIAIENTGGAPACEIELADIVPLDPRDAPRCFDADFSGLCITDGSGTQIPFTTAPGGHGRIIIKLPPGFCLAPGSPANTAGTNIALVTFNAQLQSDITPGCCDNGAQLLHYTSQSQPGGPNFVDAGFTPPFSDSATVCVNPTLTKSLVATSEPHTAGSDVTIGEIARYRLEVIVPEGGVLPNFQVTDVLPAGLKFLNDGSARIAFVSNGLGITRTALLTSAYSVNGNAPPSSPALTALLQIPPGVISVGSNCGDDPTFNLLNVQNKDNDFDLEYIVIEFNALVCNVAGNQGGTALPNTFNVSVGGSQIAASNQINVIIIEPNLTMTKTVAPNPAFEGQTLTYTVQYTNNGTADAFDVVLQDTLPAGLTLGTVTAGCPVTTISNQITMTCAQIPKAPNAGSTVIVSYQAVANPTSCPVTLQNQATLTWTSLPGPKGTLVNPTGSSTPGNPGLVDGERDGVTPLLTLNDYATTASAAAKIDCPCCLQTSNETLTCNSNGTFTYTVMLTNLTGATVTVVSFSPSAGVTITPATLTIPPLANGASTNVTVTIGGPNAVSGATVCFSVGLVGPAAPACRIQHCVTLPSCQSNCSTPPLGMVAWWPLDEPNGATVVNDIAGFNNQGVPKPGGQVGVSGPSSVAGEVLGALFFAGPHLEVPPHPELDFGLGDFSIDAWVKPVDCSHSGGGVLAPIVDKFNGTSGFAFYLDQPTVGVANLILNINGSTFVSNGTIPTLGSNTWSHVAVTIAHLSSGSVVGTFYINGVAAGSFTPPSGSVTNALPLWIGKTRIPGGTCETVIDEVEVFNRALPAAEIKSIADAKSAGKCHATGSLTVTKTVKNLWAMPFPAGTSFPITVSCLPSGPNVTLNLAAGGTQIVNNIPAGSTCTVTEGALPPPIAHPACASLGWGPPTYAPGQTVTIPRTGSSQTVIVTNTYFCNTGSACATPPPGMVAWWPLDETSGTTVTDIVDSHNGTARPAPIGAFAGPGPVTSASWPPPPFPPGKVGTSLFFEGNRRVEVPHNSVLEPGTGDFTVDAWVFYAAVGNGRLLTVAQKNTGATAQFGNTVDGWRFVISDSSSTQGLVFFIGALGVGGSVGEPITPNTWHHVAATLSTTSGFRIVKIYVDGVSLSQVGLNGNITSIAPLLIGGNGIDAGQIAVDEVEIFNRALTQQEIQAIFKADSAGKCKRACVPPPSGMVSWWPGDGNARDIQDGNNGMLISGAIFSAGKVGQAFSFDGVNDFVDMGDITALDGLSAVSWDAWINPQEYSPGHNIFTDVRSVVAKGTLAGLGTNTIFSYFQPNQAGTDHVFVCGIDTGTSLLSAFVVANNLPLNSFTHFACTWQSGQKVKLYVNGGLLTESASTLTGTLNNVASPLRIGSSSNTVEDNFKGLIDEVEIFNRALSASDIKAIFEAGSAGKCKPTPARGTVIIRKNTVGGDNTFGYTTGAGLSAFSITTSGGTGSQTFSNIVPGPKTVTESSRSPGWVFTNLTCSDPDGGTTVSGQTANIDLDAGETVICTYTNTKCPAISINPASGALPPTGVNALYTQTFTATGGCAPFFNYSVTSGALPPGLTLASNGVLSGSATQLGNFTFTVTATDSCGCSQSQIYTLTASVRKWNFAFTGGMNEFCIWGGGGVGYNSQTRIDSPLFGVPVRENGGVRFGTIGLCYGRILSVNDSFAFKYTFNATPIAVLSYRDVNPDLGFPGAVSETRRNVFGAGFSPIGLQLYFQPQDRIKPFVNTSGGFIFFKDPVPRLNGARFNFTYDFGGGLQVFRDSRRAFNFGYTYHRISNGGHAQNNPGFNAHIFYFGYSIFSAPKIAQTDDVEVKRKN